LDEDRSIDGENLSLANVIAGDSYPVFDQVADAEARAIFEERLLAKLSPLEGEVWLLYLKRYHYGEIVEELQDQFTDQQITTKTVDNALQRVRAKIRELHGPADLLLQLRSGG
jgi:DNA-directed RNA polymerase specialized sigma24 family protein